MATTDELTVTIKLDLKPFVEAIRRVGEAMQALAVNVAETAKRLTEMFAPMLREVETKRTHGRGNLDDDGLWQSDMCAGWLHDSCPFEARRYCDCTCHGGPVR